MRLAASCADAWDACLKPELPSNVHSSWPVRSRNADSWSGGWLSCPSARSNFSSLSIRDATDRLTSVKPFRRESDRPMKYLCLVYLQQEKLHAVPDRECMTCGEGLRSSGV